MLSESKSLTNRDIGSIDAKELVIDQALASLTSVIQLENTFDINALTQEARVLALIKNTPGRPLKYYLTSSGLSQRWFSIIIDKLLKAGLIEKLDSETDERSKTLR